MAPTDQPPHTSQVFKCFKNFGKNCNHPQPKRTYIISYNCLSGFKYLIEFYMSIYNYWIFFCSYLSFNDFLGRIHFSLFFIASNLILFSMHSLGIFGFARRIFDYPVIFFRYHWSNSFDMYGVALSMFFFLFPFLLF